MANTSPGYAITIRIEGTASNQPVSEITQAVIDAGASITALDRKSTRLNSSHT